MVYSLTESTLAGIHPDHTWVWDGGPTRSLAVFGVLPHERPATEDLMNFLMEFRWPTSEWKSDNANLCLLLPPYQKLSPEFGACSRRTMLKLALLLLSQDSDERGVSQRELQMENQPIKNQCSRKTLKSQTLNKNHHEKHLSTTGTKTHTHIKSFVDNLAPQYL